jgi:phosphatidylinositol-3-phosphatase
VFFRDVSGSPPSKTNAYCASHHKDYSALAGDLASGSVATFNFITPDQCNDMHGDSGCPIGNEIKSGDTWLKNNLPTIIDYVNAHQGVIFLTWDEGDRTELMPFIAVGPHVKSGYTGTVRYDHSSLLKSIEEILQLAVLPTVAGANDFSDLFEAGHFP